MKKYIKKPVPLQYKYKKFIAIVEKCRYMIKGFAAILGFIWLLSVCALDSESWIPAIVCCASGLCLVAYCWLHDFWVFNFRDGEN